VKPLLLVPLRNSHRNPHLRALYFFNSFPENAQSLRNRRIPFKRLTTRLQFFVARSSCVAARRVQHLTTIRLVSARRTWPIAIWLSEHKNRLRERTQLARRPLGVRNGLWTHLLLFVFHLVLLLLLFPRSLIPSPPLLLLLLLLLVPHSFPLFSQRRMNDVRMSIPINQNGTRRKSHAQGFSRPRCRAPEPRVGL